MQAKFEEALEGDTNLDKIIVKLGKLNKISYEDLIHSFNTNASIGKLFLDWFKNKKPEFSKEYKKVAWDKLVNNYALHTAWNLLKLKRAFQCSTLDSADGEGSRWMDLFFGRVKN